MAARRGVRSWNINNKRWRNKKLGIDFSRYFHAWVGNCCEAYYETHEDGTTSSRHRLNMKKLLNTIRDLAVSIISRSCIPYFVFDGKEPSMKKWGSKAEERCLG
jgi:5'-3' exonuclease